MLKLTTLALLSTVVHAAPARQPVIAVLPIHTEAAELHRLASLIEARTQALVEGTSKASVLDTKQVLAMAAQEAIDPSSLWDAAAADKALALLGADRVVAASLRDTEAGLTLEGTVRSGKKPVTFSATLPREWSKALNAGSLAIANAVLVGNRALAASTSAQPESASDTALQSLGTCWEVVQQQSMSIEAPVGLSEDAVRAAMKACEAAVEADAPLRFAQATLALLHTLRGDDAEVEKKLGPAIDTDPALVPFGLGQFWWLIRNHSNEAGVTFLTGVVAKHPGALLFRSYLGDALASMNEHSRAVEVWKAYLARAPASAFAQGRLSRSLARLQQPDAAIAAAAAGLKLAPESKEARLQLASRQLDAKQLAEALETLKPLANTNDAPSEAVLRYGWANWLSGDAKAAAALFETAAQRATGPHAWKTKGRALYNLALVRAKQGELEGAKAAYAKSLETGYVVTTSEPLLTEVIKAVSPRTADAQKLGPDGLYISLPDVEDKASGLSPEQMGQLRTLVREKLAGYAVLFAPEKEDKKAALAFVKQNALRGWAVQVRVAKRGEGLGVDAMVMTYPQLSIKGQWSVKASGGSPEALIRAMAPRLIEDIATDLEWR